ncbi:MAG TPA: ferric reductase-like transmembrane domain-containing protein, partial [Chloroflexota bacterium]|nr:ferric reductase-like transmembrane domain-containing protein [Chloroflexota bacterium]
MNAGVAPAAPGLLGALGGGDAGHVWWYLSRAAGLCAYVLLTLDVALGLAVRTRRLEPWLARWRAFDLHRFTALLLVAVAALHVLALLGDRYIGFSLPQLLVPFAAPYRPLWTALGVLALYLLLAIVASFFVRRVIGQRAWRRLHYLTFAVFVLALLHGVLAGTDAGTVWGVLLYLSTGGAV